MNKKVFSLICAISCSLIWGSAFVAQDMGMDYNGPFTFTFGRLFLGFLTLVPFLFIFEYKKVNSIIFKKVKDLMNDNKMDDVLLTGGGIIPQEDMDNLLSYGVGQLFGPGTPVQETIDYINDWYKNNKEEVDE